LQEPVVVSAAGRSRPAACAVAVGNFDGVHVGHAEIVRRLRAAAARHGVPAVAMTFDPHPASVVRPGTAPVPLTTRARRVELLLALGLDAVLVQPVDERFVTVAAEAFYRDVLRGRLRAAAREAEFIDPFDREAWPLASLPCQELAGVIWVAGGPGPLPLGDQLDLLLQQCPALVQRPRRLLRRTDVPLRCNWKVAHDNTLDDYHVAIAHPQTLHREQGPVRHYRHALSDHASLLATPWGDGEFLTFGLAPWTHLLLWPDGRLALIQFPPLAVDRCRLDLWLLGDDGHAASADDWLAELLRFLEEDRCLVEGAQQGYASGLQPGPPHRLELRILQHQQLYARLMADSAP